MDFPFLEVASLSLSLVELLGGSVLGVTPLLTDVAEGAVIEGAEDVVDFGNVNVGEEMVGDWMAGDTPLEGGEFTVDEVVVVTEELVTGVSEASVSVSVDSVLALGGETGPDSIFTANS